MEVSAGFFSAVSGEIGAAASAEGRAVVEAVAGETGEAIELGTWWWKNGRGCADMGRALVRGVKERGGA